MSKLIVSYHYMSDWYVGEIHKYFYENLCEKYQNINFEFRPLIIFEINYFVRGHSQEWCQKILNKFSKKGYKKINIKDCVSDGVLIPQNFI